MKRLQTPACRIVLCLTLLFVAVVLAACRNPTPIAPAAMPVALIASSTATASVTPVPPSLTSTLTRTPRRAPTRTLRPTATARSTKAPTPTTYPTLDAQGRLNFVLQALKTNMGCELPCWWGFTPGKTTWAEMVNTFAKQGIGFSKEGKLDLGAGDQKSRGDLLSVAFLKQGELVTGIGVDLADFYQLAQPDYHRLVQKYKLDQVLSRYGVPTQVHLELTVGAGDWSPGLQTTYNLWIEYTDRGVALRYPGKLITDNRGWYVCPTSSQSRSFELRLRSSEDSTASVPLVSNEDAHFQFSGTLQELTGSTLQEFHENFKLDPPLQCLLVSNPEPWYEIILPEKSAALSPRQETDFLVNQLNDGGRCELPCWWGITPGETTTQAAQDMFLKLGKGVSQWNDRRGQLYNTSLFGRYTPYPVDYTVDHRWYDENGTIKFLGVTGSVPSWSSSHYFAQDWRRYSLHEMLTRYGPPSKVLVHYWDFGWKYDITLVYEDRGFLIRYTGPIGDGEFDYTSDQPLTICPVQNKPAEITIWMTKPASDSLAQIGYGRGDLSPAGSPLLSLEEVTEMTIQQFYETFLNPNATTCLIVPRDKGEYAP